MDGTPTIHPSGSFNPERVAAKMQKAIKGMGTDERTIIEVLTSHTNSQRQEIKSRYKTMYGRDLEEDLKKDLGGSFEDACIALLVPQYEYLAGCLYDALIKDLNSNTIIDIFTTYNNWDLKTIKEKFSEKYNENLETLICDKFSGDFQRVLRALVNADRNESNAIDPGFSESEAKLLFESGIKMMGTDEDVFIRIMCCQSFEQLKDIFKQYHKLTNESIETSIAKEFSGELLIVFNAIAVSGLNTCAHYYATRLHSSLHGMGTDDETIIRIIISRSEIDLEDIKDIYKKKYNRKLTDDISDDTSGDYKKLMTRVLSPL